jgi:ABC-type polar amino acid transport system ATPase subunit
VNWALQVMGLKDLSEKPCYLLSGGEKRRLSIAGVLAMRPQVILFDEPFSFLDYPGIQEVLKHMVHLHREGHTLIVTTHDVEKVVAHVDRIAVIIIVVKFAGHRTWSSFEFEIQPPVTHFWEKKKSHGSNSSPLFPRKFLSSPLGCPMQGFGASDHHPIPSSIQISLIPI